MRNRQTAHGSSQRTWGYALLPFALLMLAAAPSPAQGINTIPLWNGTDFISSFGVPNTATYGQTITVSSNATINSFAFEIGYCGADVTMRGEVYAWDGAKATGSALFESAPYTLPNSASFQLVSFNTGSLSLPAGRYILFASTSRDQTGAPSSACRWGSLGNFAYLGGQFQFLNNGPDPAPWTSTNWQTIASDLAMQVFGSGLEASSIPASSPTSLLITIAALMGVGVFILSRRHGA
jgi:hypothetical protein